MKKYTKNINMRNVNGYEPGKIWTQVWCLKECQIIKIICFKNPQLIYEFFETCTFNLSLCLNMHHMMQELKISFSFSSCCSLLAWRATHGFFILRSATRSFSPSLKRFESEMFFYGLSEVSKPNIEFKWHLLLVYHGLIM